MPRFSLSSLQTQNAERVVTALAAGATTYIRPARFPKWIRRTVSLSNTASSLALGVAGTRTPQSSAVSSAAGKPSPKEFAGVASAASAGMALVTSGMAMRVDRSVEKFLVKRGVPHPRLIMAVGAATLSLASPWITKQIQASTAKLQAKATPSPSFAKAEEKPELNSAVGVADENERPEGEQKANA